jgi:hypothetical protein
MPNSEVDIVVVGKEMFFELRLTAARMEELGLRVSLEFQYGGEERPLCVAKRVVNVPVHERV